MSDTSSLVFHEEDESVAFCEEEDTPSQRSHLRGTFATDRSESPFDDESINFQEDDESIAFRSECDNESLARRGSTLSMESFGVQHPTSFRGSVPGATRQSPQLQPVSKTPPVSSFTPPPPNNVGGEAAAGTNKVPFPTVSSTTGVVPGASKKTIVSTASSQAASTNNSLATTADGTNAPLKAPSSAHGRTPSPSAASLSGAKRPNIVDKVGKGKHLKPQRIGVAVDPDVARAIRTANARQAVKQQSFPERGSQNREGDVVADRAPVAESHAPRPTAANNQGDIGHHGASFGAASEASHMTGSGGLSDSFLIGELKATQLLRQQYHDFNQRQREDVHRLEEALRKEKSNPVVLPARYSPTSKKQIAHRATVGEVNTGSPTQQRPHVPSARMAAPGYSSPGGMYKYTGKGQQRGRQQVHAGYQRTSTHHQPNFSAPSKTQQPTRVATAPSRRSAKSQPPPTNAARTTAPRRAASPPTRQSARINDSPPAYVAAPRHEHVQLLPSGGCQRRGLLLPQWCAPRQPPA